MRHPLLLVVHGFASSAEQFDRETNFERDGVKRGYVVLTPDGVGSPTNWNLFGAKGQPDDYVFVGALVASVTRHACVDTARVVIAGHSAGSAFAGFLACRKPYRFAVVAMVSATVPSTCPPDVTPAVISVHGTADPAVPYAGGLGIGQTVPIPPVRTTIAHLAKARRCAAKPTDTRVARDVVRRRYRNCARGDDVELFTIERGGHLWSPGTTTRILDFFDDHQGA
jgi:polyhydroxybutyrate depolymerase